MIGVLPWWVRWTCRAGTRYFCPALAAVVGQCIPYRTLFYSFVPIAQQAWQAVLLGHLSLCMCLWRWSTVKEIVSRARICKRLRRPGIDSKVSIPTAYVAWRAGTSSRVVVPVRQAENRFLGSLKVKRFTNSGSAVQPSISLNRCRTIAWSVTLLPAYSQN